MSALRCTRALSVALVVAVVGGNISVRAQQSAAGHGVELLEPFEHAAVPEAGTMAAYHFEDLAKVDPDHPLSDDISYQTLSLFGREDLIADSSAFYKATQCSPSQGAGTDVLDEIVRRARDTTVVIINESHEHSLHRGFIAEVAQQLRPLGYDTLAIETLFNASDGVPADKLPPLRTQPDLPYFSDEDGFYLGEAGFGRLGRIAKKLGYRLLPYEAVSAPASPTVTMEESIAQREEGQANNLATFLKAHPGAKMLVHVGYSHASEVPQSNGIIWMAARLKQKTGIDPLTISQTTCRRGGDAVRLAALPADQPKGIFDLIVDHPKDRFDEGRPAWRERAGDLATPIPDALRPKTGWRVIEARPVDEPSTSVPMDRVAIRPGEKVVLLLPPGRYRLRAIDVPFAANKVADGAPRK